MCVYRTIIVLFLYDAIHGEKRSYTVNEEELIAEYVSSLNAKCEEISSLLSTQSFDEITTIGHRLAGSGGSFGFPGISKTGAAIEAAGVKKDSVALAALLPQLRDELKTIQQDFVKN